MRGTQIRDWTTEDGENRQQTHYFHCDPGVHYNFFSYYDPDAGRFVNHNPIKYLGGTNFYTYAFSIVNWVDFLGLNPFRVFGKVTIIV